LPERAAHDVPEPPPDVTLCDSIRRFKGLEKVAGRVRPIATHPRGSAQPLVPDDPLAQPAGRLIAPRRS
jgi:hypothetical protein